MTMPTLETSPQRTPPSRRAREARAKANHGATPRASRPPRAIDPAGRDERELLHPSGGLEGYTLAEVQAAQARAELARRFELRTRNPEGVRAVTHYLSIGGWSGRT